MLTYLLLPINFQFGINSYPTTKLFNQTDITEYFGNHDSYGIKEFVEVRSSFIIYGDRQF